MFVKPSSAFVGMPVARRELLGQREERAVGEVVAVDEEELGVARGRVVELELLPVSVFGDTRSTRSASVRASRCSRCTVRAMPAPSTLARLLRRRAGADRRARAGRDLHRHAEHRQGAARRASSRRSGSPPGGLVHVAAAVVGLSALHRLVGDGVHRRQARRRRVPDRDRHPRACSRRDEDDAEPEATPPGSEPRRLFVQGVGRQRAQPEDGAVLPRLPAAVRRPGRAARSPLQVGDARDCSFVALAVALGQRVRARGGGARRPAARERARAAAAGGYVTGGVFVVLGVTAAAAKRTA